MVGQLDRRACDAARKRLAWPERQEAGGRRPEAPVWPERREADGSEPDASAGGTVRRLALPGDPGLLGRRDRVSGRSAARSALARFFREVWVRGDRSAVLASGRPDPLKQRDRLGGPPRVLIGRGQVLPCGLGIGVIGAQHSFPVGQGLLKQRDRLGDPAPVPVGGGEVASGVQGAGMVRTQQPLSYLQVQLVQPDRLGGPACVLVGTGEVVLRDEGFGVTGPSVRCRTTRICSNSGIASATRPAAR